MCHQNYQRLFAAIPDPLSETKNASFFDISKDYGHTLANDKVTVIKVTPIAPPAEITNISPTLPLPPVEERTTETHTSAPIPAILTSVQENKGILLEMMPLLKFVASTLGYTDTGTGASTTVHSEALNSYLNQPVVVPGSESTSVAQTRNKVAKSVHPEKEDRRRREEEPDEDFEWPLGSMDESGLEDEVENRAVSVYVYFIYYLFII